jgi:predicted nucleotidyltransferase
MFDIYKKLRELNFPMGEYVVVGGAMTAHGIRDAHDLDILVSPTLYQKLYREGWSQCTCDQCLETSRLMLKKDHVDILPNLMFGSYLGDTTTLVQEADMINGYPFIKLTEFIKFKYELGRQKDIEDIKLMQQYLSEKLNV